MALKSRSTPPKWVLILVGCGNWASTRTVIPFVGNNLERIKSVFISNIVNDDSQRAILTALEKQFPEAQKGRDLAEELVEFSVDLDFAIEKAKRVSNPCAVIINTPNALHYESALRALEKRLPVYVERPIATPEDCLPNLVDVANRNEVDLFTGSQRRLEAPFQYIYKTVRQKREFGSLSSIHCTLAVAQELKGWRTDPALAGGGIILDSGYHLLDIAVWVAEASGVEISDEISGYVRTFDLLPSYGPDRIELSSVGLLELSDRTRLQFDFTYKAPEHSITEKIEFRDDLGARLILDRNLTRRSPQPGKVTHQLADGSFAPIREKGVGSVDLNEVYLTGAADNTGPLQAFFDSLDQPTTSHATHPCHAANSIPTWRLIKRIYELAHH